MISFAKGPINRAYSSINDSVSLKFGRRNNEPYGSTTLKYLFLLIQIGSDILNPVKTIIIINKSVNYINLD